MLVSVSAPFPNCTTNVYNLIGSARNMRWLVSRQRWKIWRSSCWPAIGMKRHGTFLLAARISNCWLNFCTTTQSKVLRLHSTAAMVVLRGFLSRFCSWPVHVFACSFCCFPVAITVVWKYLHVFAKLVSEGRSASIRGSSSSCSLGASHLPQQTIS